MSGDYSRFTYEPAKDYDGVLLQQGRPLTDWDWNDWVSQVKRRQQVVRYDTFGGLPVVIPQATTPDAFKLTVATTNQQPDLAIGRGRIYVDGLLVENHGVFTDGNGNPTTGWDPNLAEQYGTTATTYLTQPYLPNAPALPTTAGPYVMYLDIWEREITQLEAPELVDVALGVDTTTRMQTVWQMKVLPGQPASGAPALTCGTDPAIIPGWVPLTTPSAGQLTTSLQADSSTILGSSGAYTGLENQLYRVEIHDGGTPGTATFKWSRDNGSVQARVIQIINDSSSYSTLVVDNLGKDSVLGFSDGDLIELTNDWLELSNQPGKFYSIGGGNGVDQATRAIRLTQLVDNKMFPADPQGSPIAANTRVRRWDQQGSAPMPVPTGNGLVLLENGIQVSFALDQQVSTANAQFKSGDYWCFASRAMDSSIEILTREPPRGIHHHYAKIGMYTPGSTASPGDCRQFWPLSSGGGDGCASNICVAPPGPKDGDITPKLQQAIDTLAGASGGTLCLECGDYPLSRPLLIQNAQCLTIRGQGSKTRLLAPATAIAISSCMEISLEQFAVSNAGLPAPPGATYTSISAQSTQNLVMHRLSLQQQIISGSEGVTICLGDELGRVRVSDTSFSSDIGIGSIGSIGVGRLEISNNVLTCGMRAINLSLKLNSTYSPWVTIGSNDVTNCKEYGIYLAGDATTNQDDSINCCVEIVGNKFSDMQLGENSNQMTAALNIQNCARLLIAKNNLYNIGPSTKFAGYIAAVAVQAFSNIEIVDNSIRRSDSPESIDTSSSWRGVHITDGSPFGTAYDSRISIRGNQISASGQSAAVYVVSEATLGCDFSNNQCYHVGVPSEDLADAYFSVMELVCGGNRFYNTTGGTGTTSILAEMTEPFYTFFGNITSGVISVIIDSAPPAKPVQIDMPENSYPPAAANITAF